jgi:hypothetical protein
LDNIDTLLRHTGSLRIAHHIPGRIRLKLLPDMDVQGPEAVATATRLSSALHQTPGIRSVSLNPLARSCTVEYDPSVIPAEAWSDFLKGIQTPAATILLDALTAATRASGN